MREAFQQIYLTLEENFPERNLPLRRQRSSFDQSLIERQELPDKCSSYRRAAWQPQEQTKIDSKTNAKKVSDRLDCAKFIQTHIHACKGVCQNDCVFWRTTTHRRRRRFRSFWRNSRGLGLPLPWPGVKSGVGSYFKLILKKFLFTFERSTYCHYCQKYYFQFLVSSLNKSLQKLTT